MGVMVLKLVQRTAEAGRASSPGKLCGSLSVVGEPHAWCDGLSRPLDVICSSSHPEPDRDWKLVVRRLVDNGIVNFELRPALVAALPIMSIFVAYLAAIYLGVYGILPLVGFAESSLAETMRVLLTATPGRYRLDPCLWYPMNPHTSCPGRSSGRANTPTAYQSKAFTGSILSRHQK